MSICFGAAAGGRHERRPARPHPRGRVLRAQAARALPLRRLADRRRHAAAAARAGRRRRRPHRARRAVLRPAGRWRQSAAGRADRVGRRHDAVARAGDGGAIHVPERRATRPDDLRQPAVARRRRRRAAPGRRRRLCRRHRARPAAGGGGIAGRGRGTPRAAAGAAGGAEHPRRAPARTGLRRPAVSLLRCAARRDRRPRRARPVRARPAWPRARRGARTADARRFRRVGPGPGGAAGGRGRRRHRRQRPGRPPAGAAAGDRPAGRRRRVPASAARRWTRWPPRSREPRHADRARS